MFLSSDGWIQCRGMGGLYLDPIRPPRFEAMANLSKLAPVTQDPTRCAVCGQSSDEEVTAERERCAKIAESFARRGSPTKLWSDLLAPEIAAAIRRGPETGESTAPKTQPEANE